MTLPASGPISMDNIRNELFLTASTDLNSVDVRNLAGILSGSISLSDLRGKSGNARPYIMGWTVNQTSVTFTLRIGGLTQSNLSLSYPQSSIDTGTWVAAIENVWRNTDKTHTVLANPGTYINLKVKQVRAGSVDSIPVDLAYYSLPIPKVIPKLKILGVSQYYTGIDNCQVDILVNYEELKYRRSSADVNEEIRDDVFTEWSLDGGVTWDRAGRYATAPGEFTTWSDFQNISDTGVVRMPILFTVRFIASLSIKFRMTSRVDRYTVYNTNYIASDVSQTFQLYSSTKSPTPTVEAINPTKSKTATFKVTCSPPGNGSIAYSTDAGVTWTGNVSTSPRFALNSDGTYILEIPTQAENSPATVIVACWTSGSGSLPSTPVTAYSWIIPPQPVVYDEPVSGCTKRTFFTNNSSSYVELQVYKKINGSYTYWLGRIIPPNTQDYDEYQYGFDGNYGPFEYRYYIQQINPTQSYPVVYVTDKSNPIDMAVNFTTLPGYQEDGPYIGNRYQNEVKTLVLRNRWVANGNLHGVLNNTEQYWEVEIRDTSNVLIQTRRVQTLRKPGVASTNAAGNVNTDLVICIGSLTPGTTYKIRTRQTNSNGTDIWSPYGNYTVPASFSNVRCNVSTPDILFMSRSGRTVNFRFYNPINEGVWLQIAFSVTLNRGATTYLSNWTHIYVEAYGFSDVSNTYDNPNYTLGLATAFLYQPSVNAWSWDQTSMVVDLA